MTVSAAGPKPAINSPTEVQLLCNAVNLVDSARHDIATVTGMLTDGAPLFAVVDVVAALSHLRQAAVLIDKAADQFEIASASR